MHQVVRAMTVAGMLATGLPLLTEAANADGTIFTPGAWNLIVPATCQTFESPQAGGGTITSMQIYNGEDFAHVYDSLAISALFRICYDGLPIYGFYTSPSAGFTSFWTYPGLR